MHKASEKKVMLFDLELGDQEPKPNAITRISTINKKHQMLDLDTATTIAMQERQRSVSAPMPVKRIEAPDAGREGKIPPAFLASLEPVYTLSTPPASQSTSATTTPSSITLDSSHDITFGPKQELALSPQTLHDDDKRQAAPIRPRQIEGLTMKRRLLADEASRVREEDLMMSGALDVGDVRCEVFAAREMAMGGLEEAGIVAL